MNTPLTWGYFPQTALVVGLTLSKTCFGAANGCSKKLCTENLHALECLLSFNFMCCLTVLMTYLERVCCRAVVGMWAAVTPVRHVGSQQHRPASLRSVITSYSISVVSNLSFLPYPLLNIQLKWFTQKHYSTVP